MDPPSLATGGALFGRKRGILDLEHQIVLHRSLSKKFCAGSIDLFIFYFQLTGFVKIWLTGWSKASEVSIFPQTRKWKFFIKNQRLRKVLNNLGISTFPELYKALYAIFRQTLVVGDVKWSKVSIPRKIFLMATGGAPICLSTRNSHVFFQKVLHWSPIHLGPPDFERWHQNWLPTTRVCHLDLRRKKPKHILIKNSIPEVKVDQLVLKLLSVESRWKSTIL